MSINTSEYFVRIDRQIRGPFSRDVLTSMFSRGRVGPNSEVSSDRSYWVQLRTLGEPFASGAAMLDDLSASTPAGPPPVGEQYFCTIDGETQGPMPLSTLQRLVSTGRLEMNDQVWQQGQPAWMAAADVPGLAFASQPQQAKSWISNHLALFISLVLMAVTIIALPTYYVFAAAAARQAERIAFEIAAKEIAEKLRTESEIKDRIAREEKRFAQQLELQKNQFAIEMARLSANDRDTEAIERRHQEELAQRQRQHNEQMELLRKQIDAQNIR